MTSTLFNKFPALWDAFEQQLKSRILRELSAKNPEGERRKLSEIYDAVGFDYWCCGAGEAWKKQLDEVFFEHRYHSTIMQLYRYFELDALAAHRMKILRIKNTRILYRFAVKPFLKKKKQELTDAFSQLEKELDQPLPYVLKVPVDGDTMPLSLGFRKRYKKRNWNGMDGYTYSFNGRTYKDIQAFTTPTIEKLSEAVSIARDTFGDLVLRRYTQIPTFDSGDREWDSAEIEYLMFDGKDIHLIVMRGGYRIAHLMFFEELLTADSRMKPIFEKLGWPTEGITWI